MVPFNRPPACYWSEKTKLEYLQRRVLVYSYLYYQMDVSVVSDYDYDDIAKQLVKMQKEASKEAKESTRYWYVFHDFDGNTGFHLSYGLSREDFVQIGDIAHVVYDSWRSTLSPEERAMLVRVKQMKHKAKEVDGIGDRW